MNVYEPSNGKAFNEHVTAYLPRPCHALRQARPACPCARSTATDKNEEGGIVSQIYPRCFGCRYCMASCPYHARYFNWYDPLKWPEGMDKDLCLRTCPCVPRGVVEKCTFCHSPLDLQAKDMARAQRRRSQRIWPDGAYVTACALRLAPTGPSCSAT